MQCKARDPKSKPHTIRFLAKREQLEICQGLIPESQGQTLALTVVYVPCSLHSASPNPAAQSRWERAGKERALFFFFITLKSRVE